ncbi:MAG: discoidin domain-containing protein [Verrucomicrobiaceae bacterium]|nr:discoidin domain-containing protein [Verrucomicrobiaceae bacterium]
MISRHLSIFDTPACWLSVASGQAELNLSSSRGALRLDFDFKGGRGFVVARREIRLALPAEFVLRFRLRGRGPVNHVEVKLADVSGKNVWRHERKDFALPSRAKEMRIASHDIEFAWGPAGGGVISEAGALEFAIVAGEGGAGTVWLSDFSIEDHSLTRAPRVTFSSARRKPSSSLVATGAWQPLKNDARPWLSLDFHEPRLIGGLVVEWSKAGPPDGFRVRGSHDGVRWKLLYSAPHAGGTRSYIFLPRTKTRCLRLEAVGPVSVRSLRWQSIEFSRSREAFWHHVAAREPRGWHPRWLMREQSLWTPVGIPGGSTCALINEEGMIEVAGASFSIEPFVFVDGRLFTWADVRLRQSLRDGWRPVPSVFWETAEWTLQIEASVSATGDLHARYVLRNLTRKKRSFTVFAAIRPIQVTPPWQRFRESGGMGRIKKLGERERTVLVENTLQIVPRTENVSIGAMIFDEGPLVGRLATGKVPRLSHVEDALGLASGALAFRLDLPPHGEKETGWITNETRDSCKSGQSRDSHAPDPWAKKLPEHQLRAPSWAADAIRALLTATAHILVTRAGPALQPGPRRYTRSWIRDGTIMSAALLRMGCAAEVREFIRWYAPHQRGDGFIPCCVDRDGPDWLVEHDSHGQFLALIADYVRFTGDAVLLAGQWPRVAKTASFIESLIEPAGLLPISASHEGYLAQPVHSYWDDFWAVRGLRDAAALAARLDHHAEAARWRDTAKELSAALLQSIESTRATKQLDYIPGSLEWADFDPTATANAVTLGSLMLDDEALTRTFDKYLADWRKKRRGDLEWTNYTPYEIRIIGALVRLGRRDDALELLRFFLSDRRPLAWNQWPEIAWRDPRAPGHIGDVPHTWIAAEYVLAVQSLFAYESESRRAIIIAAGLAPEWLEGDGVLVKEMPTTFGALSYSLRATGGKLVCEISRGITVPPGGLVLRPPLAAPVLGATINGSCSRAFDGGEIVITEVPAHIVVECRSAGKAGRR